MRAVLRLALPTVLLLAQLALPGTSSAAPDAVDRLASAAPGTSITLAPGYSLITRSGPRSGQRGPVVSRATLKIGTAAVGRDVRVSADRATGTVSVSGGTFTVPRSLSRQRWTTGRAPLVFRDGQVAGGALRPLARRRSSDDPGPVIGSALPAAPAGQTWSLTIELRAEGLYVGLLLDRSEAGSVLIRPDRSYRISLRLPGVPIFGRPVTIGGELTGDDIFNLGSISGLRGSLEGNLEIAPGVFIRRGAVAWDRSGFTVTGTIAVACAGGGELTGDPSLRLGPDSGDWEVGFLLAVGQEPCVLADELTLDPGTKAEALLRSSGTGASVKLGVTAKVRTTLIPTESAFTVKLAITAGAGGSGTELTGTTDGASFDGTIGPGGALTIDFELTDLKLLGTTVAAKGRVIVPKLGAEPQVTLSGGISGELWLVPDLLAVTSVDLGVDLPAGNISVAATLRLRCTTGTLDLGASGRITGKGDSELLIAGSSDKCTVAESLLLDGRTLSGRIAYTAGKLDVELGLLVKSLAFGDPAAPPAINSTALRAQDIAARITNRCAQCADGTRLLIAFEGAFDIAAWLPPNPPLRLGATIRFGVLMGQDGLAGLGLSLVDVSVFGSDASLRIDLGGELRRTLEAAIGLPPGTLELVPLDDTTFAPVRGADAPGRVLSVTATLSRCRTTGSCRPRVALTVRTTGRGATALTLERRACRRGSCRWLRLTRAVLTPSDRYVARAAGSRGLSPGSYRAVARPSGRSGAAVTRTFRVF